MKNSNTLREPRLLSPLVWGRIPLYGRVLLGAAMTASLVVIAYLVITRPPDGLPPRGSEAERQIAAVFGVPPSADEVISGDLLVERYYVLNVDTGERYVADFIRGRVQSVQTTVRRDSGGGAYTLLLDLSNLQRDRNLLAAFVDEVARPDEGAAYLGLRVPNGLTDAFQLNFDGSLPERHVVFRTNRGEDTYTFLQNQRFEDVTVAPRLVGVEGYNFLLSNTELYGHFRNEFRVEKGILLSELIVIDTTAREQIATYLRLRQQYSR
jgi:hypothetical protein